MVGEKEQLIEALRRLRRTSLAFTALSVLSAAALVLGLALAFTRPGYVMWLSSWLKLAASVAALALILALLAPTMYALRSYSSRYVAPSRLAVTGLLASAILSAAAASLLLALVGAKPVEPMQLMHSLNVAILVDVVALIAGLIGYVGILMAFSRIGDEVGVTLFTVAGILLVIGTFVPGLGLVGWLLAYVASGRGLEKLGARP
jgi:uncharacterized membrane protein